MPYADTGMRARVADESGYVTRPDGLRLYYEVFGNGPKTLVLLPCSPICHSRMWKGQVHYLARHYRVVTYDGVGNGNSDHPDPAGKWPVDAGVNDCVRVMDKTDTKSAILVGECSDGVWPAIQLAAAYPDRVLGIVALAPGVPKLTPPLPYRLAALATYEEELEKYEGWSKHNRHYIKENFRDFMEFWFTEMFPEPHSTKQIEDTIAYALDGRVETLLLEGDAEFPFTVEEIEAVCAKVRCPVLVIQGDLDHCQPFDRGVRTAELTHARSVVLPGSGHLPLARRPVKVNELIQRVRRRWRGFVAGRARAAKRKAGPDGQLTDWAWPRMARRRHRARAAAAGAGTRSRVAGAAPIDDLARCRRREGSPGIEGARGRVGTRRQ